MRKLKVEDSKNSKGKNVFNCENCVYGVYLYADSCWDSGCKCVSEKECLKRFKCKNEKVRYV